ncbi:Irregular chiasm C-roughest protein [Trachymyrmex septentrionalis]|uniref:Irregular chiasm C-roughest protein n=1 Tax=Trachymyrmex septentrionalis TaxID=34720 RepID=A0A195FDB2_9HYME|nr:Irregular chiasm C-roughest protein [Trachymyrmex septentrionalis]
MEAKTVAAMDVTNASSVVVSTLKPFTTTEVVYQRFAIEPMDQTAVIGSRVTLPCRVLDQKGPIQWTKDDFGLGAVRNLTGYERYAMIGSDEEGKYKRNKIIPEILFSRSNGFLHQPRNVQILQLCKVQCDLRS